MISLFGWVREIRAEPYIVRRNSKLPLWGDDALHLEVAIDEVDLDSISFPPLGLDSTRQSDGLYLTALVHESKRGGGSPSHDSC